MKIYESQVFFLTMFLSLSFFLSNFMHAYIYLYAFALFCMIVVTDFGHLISTILCFANKNTGKNH